MREFFQFDGTTRTRAIVASVSGTVAGTTGALVAGDPLQQSVVALCTGVAAAAALLHHLK